MTTEPKAIEVKTLDQLKAEIALAATSGDDKQFNALIKEYNSRKAEIAKALAEQMRKEEEALAGVRMEVATAIHAEIRSNKKLMALIDRFAELKSKGFTYRLDEEIDGVMTSYKSVSLLTPQAPKARASSGGGAGASGKTKEELGMTLDELFNTYATDEEKGEVAQLRAEVEGGSLDSKKANSKIWAIKNTCKKRVLKDGLLNK